MFCETCDSRYLIGLAKTLKRWQPYILNYFNRFSTNAFTEGCHMNTVDRFSFQCYVLDSSFWNDGR